MVLFPSSVLILGWNQLMNGSKLATMFIFTKVELECKWSAIVDYSRLSYIHRSVESLLDFQMICHLHSVTEGLHSGTGM